MAILIKVQPQEIVDLQVLIDVPRYPANIADNGDIAYVWFAESQGGQGLVARGIIESFIETNGCARVSIGQLTSAIRCFGNTQLGPYRDSVADRPESSLAKKIYRFSHNRAVELTNNEVAFLDQFIG